MKRRRRRTFVVRDAATLRALRTPIRQEVLGALERLGRASVGDMAQALGRKPASLYYHVHELIGAGLIVEAGSRTGAYRAEALYETTAERIIIDRSSSSKAFTEALVGLHRAALRAAERETADSLERDRARGEAPDESTTLLRLSTRLSPADAKRAVEKLRELARFMETRGDPNAGSAFSFTASLVRLADDP